MPFKKEPAFQHGQAERTAVLLCNLGTPDEPTAPALRRYLAEFLGDHRVVEIPRPIWRLILHGIILRTRPAKSARKYASIWTPEGSPLKVWTSKQATLLRGWLGERGHLLTVRYAMRYGNPSIASELDQLKAEGATRILIVPLYPQYSGTTTASVFDAFFAERQRVEFYGDALPALAFLSSRYPLVALSNGNADVQRVGIGHHFCAAFSATTLGVGKPDPRMFQVGARAAGASPEAVLHIGDDAHLDGVGALNAGMQMAWVNRGGHAWEHPVHAPHVTVAELRSLCELLS